MAISIFPTPFKQTPDEFLLSSAATIIYKALMDVRRENVSISDICERPQYGFTASAEKIADGPRFIRITDIKGGSINWETVPYCSCNVPEPYIIKQGDILVARAGSIGKSFLVKEVPEIAVFASYMIRLRTKKSVLPDYVYWFFQSQQYWLQIASFDRGSAMSNINGKMLSALILPKASLVEQKVIANFLQTFRNRLVGEKVELPELPSPLGHVRRIVARIEALAARVNEAQRLRREAVEEAKSFIQITLREVFSEAAHWQTHILDEVAPINMGQSPPGDSYNFDREGVPLLNGPTEFGYEHPTPVQWTTSPTKFCEPGDILICVRGATTGRMNWADQIYCIGRGLAALTTDTNKCLPEYVFYFVRTQTQEILARTAGSTFPNLPGAKLRTLPIPVPPLFEQKRIVSYLNGLQEQVDVLRQLQAETQQELDVVLPSILNKAFKGEL